MKEHMTLNERLKIEQMLNAKHNFSDIAREIGKNRSTISREIGKHTTEVKKYLMVGHSMIVRNGRIVRRWRIAEISIAEDAAVQIAAKVAVQRNAVSMKETHV